MSDIDAVGTTAGNVLQPPTEVHRITLRDGLTEVALVSLGAAVHDVRLGGASVALGLDTIAAREDPSRNPYLGVTVGRFANRIRDARFRIDDTTHHVEPNEGRHQLHGGPVGFGHVVWDMDVDGAAVQFRRRSPAGEMGFPGTVDATVTYRLADHTLHVDHRAQTDAATVISMTNHTYWNLGGPTTPDVRDHLVTVDASRVVPVDESLLPAGPPIDVEGGPFDLRHPTRLADRIDTTLPAGYDHCFLPGGTGLRRHARIEHPGAGRALEVWSDQPAVQLYTGGGLDGGTGTHGRRHHRFAGLCVEPQHIPDAPNLAWAPTAVLRAEERYVHRLELRLST